MGKQRYRTLIVNVTDLRRGFEVVISDLPGWVADFSGDAGRGFYVSTRTKKARRKRAFG
jgi:hypothetical protein